MAHVDLYLYATLRKHANGQPHLQVAIEPHQTIRQLLGQLGIPLEETRILFINNCVAKPDQPLQDGDRLGVFPAIGGG
jgi:sulfur carrier protein ThiS